MQPHPTQFGALWSAWVDECGEKQPATRRIRAATAGSCPLAVLLLLLSLTPHPAAHAAPPAGDPDRGRVLIERYHCGRCHTIPGVAAARGTLAVPLGDYGLRSYIAGRVPNEPATLARWIERPQSVIPGTRMPDMGVSAPDARDIAAWLGRGG